MTHIFSGLFAAWIWETKSSTNKGLSHNKLEEAKQPKNIETYEITQVKLDKVFDLFLLNILLLYLRIKLNEKCTSSVSIGLLNINT